MPEKGKSKLRVIIVGGSVSGLTLAHCLHHSNIEFVLLEAGKEIAPQIGASIVVLASGARILDQFGIWDDVLKVTGPIDITKTWTEDGKLITNANASRLVAARYVPSQI